ncbi:S-adenosyl-L-methionine-dependent methyltransferase [Limtongia smithiae]|uniref:S-adenosyl-L-methionine-dependent methyltransferase n=1 Tax=Limtongia smithiae TaxID=1125753 RepID=UPI0034CE1D70
MEHGKHDTRMTSAVSHSPPSTGTVTTDSAAVALEREHVHKVYEEIASHFSQTRYKPWPIVSAFLLAREPGSVGVDIGCGNGKYLNVNREVYIVATDMSANLASIARKEKVELAVADGQSPPARADVGVADALFPATCPGRCDFAISIAVVHHFASRARRVEVVRCVLGSVRRGGRALIYVWALEQQQSRRGWDEHHAQDVMVPWVTANGKAKGTTAGSDEAEAVVKERYYHLYRKGELEEDIVAAGGVIVTGGYERDNWWVEATPST